MIAFLRFLWFPSLVVLITVGWLRLDSAMGWRGVHLPRAGALVLTAGLLLVSWCASILLGIGKGTPNPFAAKTKRLVTSGPYGLVRNPMMYGIGAVLVGLTLLLASVGLWFGFALFIVFALLFVPLYEEPDMERRFGAEYQEYCRRVPRWWPHFQLKKRAR